MRLAAAFVCAGLAAAPATANARFGAVPTPSQLRGAVIEATFREALGTVNCGGSTECWNSGLQIAVRNADCTATGQQTARCTYEFRNTRDKEWERETSDLRVDARLDGKIGWRIVQPQ